MRIINNKKNAQIIRSGQIFIILFIYIFGIAFILEHNYDNVIATILLFIAIVHCGLVFCRKTNLDLDDPSLGVLSYFWIFKLCILFFLLYMSWVPLLKSGTGYDPVRYYFQAQELIEANWSTEQISLNYTGILYYYGAIFYVFGHNPLAPALINAFVTLIASLYLVRFGYRIKGTKEKGDWTLSLGLLVPEVLWFDVITSRETLIAALLIFSMLTAGNFFLQIRRISLVATLVVVGASTLSIALIRTSMLVPLFSAILLMSVFVNSKNKSSKNNRVAIIALAVILLLFGQLVNKFIGGNAINIVETLRMAISAKDNIALSTGMHFNENSISLLLMPDDFTEAILFLPFRMILYLIAPLPNIVKPIGELLSGNMEEWQTFFTILSSVLNLFIVPYVLGGLIYAIKVRKKDSGPLVMQISFWCTFIAIAGGNLIIHERYRVMASLLLFGCAWLGAKSTPKKIVIITTRCWYIFLVGISFPYLIYKYT